MRPAARLLLAERDAIRPVLDAASPDEFDLSTVCDGWSVRDVLAHCAAALTMCADGSFHAFTPADNQADVDLRRGWELDEVLKELYAGYETAARAIDAAGGELDGLGLGEWVHGGDVRDPLGRPDAYTSPGAELAVGLITERSVHREAVPLDVTVDGVRIGFGVGRPEATLRTDLETFVRLAAGRRPDPGRYHLEGAEPVDVGLFD